MTIPILFLISYDDGDPEKVFMLMTIDVVPSTADFSREQKLFLR